MIDVIIPAYNSQKYLAAAVDSVKKQTVRADNIYIVDDGSTDGSADFAMTLDGVKVLRKTNGGAGSARNLGLRQSKADYIFFLDADDVAAPEALEILLQPLVADSELIAVFAQSEDFYSEDLRDEMKNNYRVMPAPYFGRIAGCSLIKRIAFEDGAVGQFDPTLRTGETVAWYAKLRDMKFKTKNIAEVVLHRRIHMTNTGIIDKEQERKDYLQLIRRRLQSNRG